MDTLLLELLHQLGMSPVLVVAAMGHVEGMRKFLEVDPDVAGKWDRVSIVIVHMFS